MKAVKGEEIVLSTENKIGLLGEVANLVKDSDVNIRALNAYVIEDKAIFRLVTSDNAKAKEILKNAGSVDATEVVIVEMADKVGELADLASKLKDANIDLRHIYGSTMKEGEPANVIFASNNNDKALEVISV
jgi:hypothetical protein